MVYHLLKFNLNSKELNKHWPDFYSALIFSIKKACNASLVYV
jgi:hypothetical protein